MCEVLFNLEVPCILSSETGRQPPNVVVDEGWSSWLHLYKHGNIVSSELSPCTQLLFSDVHTGELLIFVFFLPGVTLIIAEEPVSR